MGKRSTPYSSRFTSKAWNKRRGYDSYYDYSDEDAEYEFDFFWSPPSQMRAKVKPFRDKPVVNFSKGQQFLSFQATEFFDLCDKVKEIIEKMNECKLAIYKANRKSRRHPGSRKEGNFKQIQPSECSKKEAEEMARLASAEALSESSESDGPA